MRTQTKQNKKPAAKEVVQPRGRIDGFLSAWARVRRYLPLILTLGSVALYLTARTYWGGTNKTAQLKFVEHHSEQNSNPDLPMVEPSRQIFSGEAYETSLRLRESGALLMAISLASFEEFRINSKFPATCNDVLQSLKKRSLLPPGVEVEDESLRSTLSELKLNCRPDPFLFEIISTSASDPGGPAMLFRFPLPPGEANSIIYFKSQKKPPIIPSVFSTPEQLVAAGWSIKHWRGEALPLDDSAVRELNEQTAWLKSAKRGEN